MLTPYQYASNTPIQAIDLDGLEAYYFNLLYQKFEIEPKISIVTSDETIKKLGYYTKKEVEEYNRQNDPNLNVIVPDFYGNAYQGKQIDAQKLVKLQEAEYKMSVGQNISSGIITSIAYLISNDDALTFKTVKYDEMLLAMSGFSASLQYGGKLSNNEAFTMANIAMQQELRIVSKLSNSQQNKIIMMVSGVNIKTGVTATVYKYSGLNNGKCAEDLMVEMLGGDASLIRFSSPYRPSRFRANGTSFEVCETCQTKYNESQFAPATKFETEKK